jgi:hypothetical protein
VPAILPPLKDTTRNDRLALARWVVDPAHPLTARVQVNRTWQHFFGEGLVRTPEDFGVQGDRPSHPALLDWLAIEFVRSGWNVKAMHRLIVTSATYRQSARVTPALLARDPDNRLFARGPRFRLSAEMLRDQALAVSGLLVERLGGPSVKPYQPPGLWEELTGSMSYVPDTGPSLYRRSLYTFWKRTVAPPMMATFDGPGREMCSVRRSRTNTPLQALTLLNEVTFTEAARVFAERILREGGQTDRERLRYAYRLATGRTPGEQELQIIEESLRAYRADFRDDPESAKQLTTVGEYPADPSLDAVELAAYATVASTLLNLDEVLSRP